MRKVAILCTFVVLAAFGSGCAMFGSKPPMTQLQIREFQTRNFDTNNIKVVMKAMLAVLQDDGFTVKNADLDLGFVSAVKETALSSSSFPWSVGSSSQKRWDASVVVEATINVSEFGKQSKVRASFQKKTLDNFGSVTQAGQISDEKFYQDFFAKVDKGIFLQKENL